jgi:hypothetical protein
LLGDPANVRANLTNYIGSFSDNVRDVFERFNFQPIIDRLDQDNLLFLVAKNFASIDMHPNVVSKPWANHNKYLTSRGIKCRIRTNVLYGRSNYR